MKLRWWTQCGLASSPHGDWFMDAAPKVLQFRCPSGPLLPVEEWEDIPEESNWLAVAKELAVKWEERMATQPDAARLRKQIEAKEKELSETPE